VTDSDDSFLAAGWIGSLIIEAQDLRGNEEAAKRAKQMRAAERLAAYEMTATIGGHGIGTTLAAIDRNVSINAPRAGIRNARVYCVRRAFEHSKPGGSRTNLTLIRRGLWENTL
jgi:prophage tail gpP-like protein